MSEYKAYLSSNDFEKAIRFLHTEFLTAKRNFELIKYLDLLNHSPLDLSSIPEEHIQEFTRLVVTNSYVNASPIAVERHRKSVSQVHSQEEAKQLIESALRERIKAAEEESKIQGKAISGAITPEVFSYIKATLFYDAVNTPTDNIQNVLNDLDRSLHSLTETHLEKLNNGLRDIRTYLPHLITFPINTIETELKNMPASLPNVTEERISNIRHSLQEIRLFLPHLKDKPFMEVENSLADKQAILSAYAIPSLDREKFIQQIEAFKNEFKPFKKTFEATHSRNEENTVTATLSALYDQKPDIVNPLTTKDRWQAFANAARKHGFDEDKVLAVNEKGKVTAINTAALTIKDSYKTILRTQHDTKAPALIQAVSQLANDKTISLEAQKLWGETVVHLQHLLGATAATTFTGFNQAMENLADTDPLQFQEIMQHPGLNSLINVIARAELGVQPEGVSAKDWIHRAFIAERAMMISDSIGGDNFNGTKQRRRSDHLLNDLASPDVTYEQAQKSIDYIAEQSITLKSWLTGDIAQIVPKQVSQTLSKLTDNLQVATSQLGMKMDKTTGPTEAERRELVTLMDVLRHVGRAYKHATAAMIPDAMEYQKQEDQKAFEHFAKEADISLQASRIYMEEKETFNAKAPAGHEKAKTETTKSKAQGNDAKVVTMDGKPYQPTHEIADITLGDIAKPNIEKSFFKRTIEKAREMARSIVKKLTRSGHKVEEANQKSKHTSHIQAVAPSKEQSKGREM